MLPLCVIVMAKAPRIGRVKTRLIGAYGPERACAIHAAMLRCVLRRVESAFAGPRQRRVLALDGDGVVSVLGGNPSRWDMVRQGDGDLGARMLRVWRGCGGAAAMFLGVDSPDVPASAMNLAAEAVDDEAGLPSADVALGPAMDGGYWTLSARRLHAALLDGIDWGTAGVYDQTLARAGAAGLRVRSVDPWPDVDTPGDVVALRARLRDLASDVGRPGGDEAALTELRAELDRIHSESRP